MKLSLVLVSMLACAGAAQAQFSSASGRAQQHARMSQPHVASPLPPAPLVGGSDTCAAPDVITGTGSFAFDTSAATTGSEGQSTVNCIAFNLISIPNDVWFTWTAPQSGHVEISSCGSTIDTKIAVYSGTTCPGAGATAVGCNDDFSAFSLQSKVFFDVTAGQQLMIQIGISPAPPPAIAGPGTFTIDFLGDVCAYDDGNTENSIGLTNGGEVGWLHAMGSVGTSTTISAVSTAWGQVGALSVPAGQAATVLVWDDPNDDGDPTDAVLVASAATTIVNPGSDLLQTVTLATPVSVNGVFFIGAVTANAMNEFAAPIDSDGCGYRPGVAWLVGAPGGTIDVNNLANNGVPPATLDSINVGFPANGVFLLQGTCGNGAAGTPFCAGDGSGTACPCGNDSAPGSNSGCLSSLGTGGKLVGVGNTSLSSDTLVLQGTQMPNSSALYFQGTTQQNGGLGSVFGDGLRCAGGAVIRLGTALNAAGSSQYPAGAQAAVHVKGNVSAPGMRTYQCWYRNAAAFCTASTFNLSNGLSITWIP